MHDYIAQHPRGSEPGATLWPGRRHAAGASAGVMDWARPLDMESYYRYHVKRALADAGLAVGTRGVPGVRFHDQRHT